MRILLLLLCLLPLIHLQAQTQSIAPAVYNALSSARQAQAEGNLAQARQTLREALSDTDSESLEAALLHQRLGYLAIATDDYPTAIRALRTALESEQLAAEVARQDRLNLAQLYLLDEQPQAAIELFVVARNREPLPLNSKRLLVQAYMQTGQYRAALPLAEEVVSADAGAEDIWYQLLVGLNHRLQRFRAAADWQQVLVRRNPGSVSAWRQLAGLQSLAGQQRAAAASLRLAREAGLDLSEQDMDNLIALQVQAGAPWQAARLTEELMAAGLLASTPQRQRQLAQLWQQARDHDRALAAWTRVAEASGRSEHWLQVAGLHLQQADWPALLTILERAESNANSRQRQQIAEWRHYARQYTELDN
ncbi:tetratricopeptide repeat protein [Halopseudomonas salegens]|uniref:Uncharacterized protein n=1 Tax=Halopseudomonas salegens TaxID=1434072 RepID=A0A1H2EGW1_9GAMM|nr:hypothetical protein [Halopseudomonas salegens]SDT94331.1 hypothetical protein SAMN05216210_0711 [Halopseudomonas salegens]